jgi:signal transduction histidine kinase
MVERTAATGEDFLRSLTEQLGTTLGASHCFVAELDPDRPARVRTLAKWTRAGFQPNTEYDLAGTPCEHAVGRQACYFASGVRELFPADAMLQASDVDSYLGIALSDSQGGRLGLLSAMSDRPIATRGIDARTLLEILAGRAAAEIDRLRSERRRRAAEAAARDMEAQVAYAQKLESLGVLAGGIAHDFNNLLVGVLGNAGLVLADLEPDSPLRPPVEQIETAAVRAAELTDQMLAYSGRGPFTTAAVDMTGLVREMGRLLEAVLSKKARVRYDCDPDLPAVDGDAAQLRQVVMNLLTNASEALGDGDGEIQVTVSRREVSPEALAACQVRGDALPGPAIAIVVADTGCGMDEETSRRIFDPFFTTKFTGRGLGLAAVAGIVRGHRGAIRISSAPGRGTTFTVLLPAAAAPASAVGAATHAPSSRGAGTVLVVDDEPPVRQVSRQALERAGFTVVEAEDGEAALELFARDPDAVALVLLDLTMPRMDGGETLRRLRETRPGVRVVLTSGFKQGEATDRAAGDSSLPFIQKPYQVSALVEKVHEVLGLAAS